MVQGDEPMVTPGMIDLALAPLLESEDVQVSNLYARMRSREEFEDPNEVKVVLDTNSDALYFSREPIPSNKKWNGSIPMYKQVCIIPFRRDFLLEFNKMPETELERIESVDMMRILEHGGKVRMVRCDEQSYSVDTPQDLAHVVELMKDDTLRNSYTPGKSK
jgi:3-deoxy-manno-octulosonate cytidylyltransferase (CMP-KDO synthetase)